MVNGLTKKLSHQALHDPLTGLSNRQSFEISLAAAVELSRNQEVTHAICHLDLDHFHVINSNYGTAAGDALLQQLAKLLKWAMHLT